jgi:chromosome segregation ATPase
MTHYQLAQISTGNNNFDYVLNELLPVVGPIGLTVIGLILLAIYVIKITTDARVVRITQENRQQGIVNDLAERVPKLEDSVRQEQKERYIAEGRVNELSQQLRHVQDKYEQREKEWNADRQKLKEEIERLSKESHDNKAQIEDLQNKLNGKESELKSLVVERESLKTQIADIEREKLELGLEIERLKKTVKEQSEQIQALAKQLAELDPPKQESAVADVTPQSDIQALVKIERKEEKE